MRDNPYESPKPEIPLPVAEYAKKKTLEESPWAIILLVFAAYAGWQMYAVGASGGNPYTSGLTFLLAASGCGVLGCLISWYYLAKKILYIELAFIVLVLVTIYFSKS